MKITPDNPFAGADEAYFVEPAEKNLSFREYDFGPYRGAQTVLCTTNPPVESNREGRVAIDQDLSKFVGGQDSFFVDPVKYVAAFHRAHDVWPLCAAKSCVGEKLSVQSASDVDALDSEDYSVVDGLQALSLSEDPWTEVGGPTDCSPTDRTMFDLLKVLEEIDGFVGIQSYADWQQYSQKVNNKQFFDMSKLGNGLRYDVLQARAALRDLGFHTLADPNNGKVMITETGWPTSLPSEGAKQQQMYLQKIIDAASGGQGRDDPLYNVPLFVFMAFDDCNKPGAEEEKHFGLLSMQGLFKDGSQSTETVCPAPEIFPEGGLPCNKNEGWVVTSTDPSEGGRVERITCQEAHHRSWVENVNLSPLKDVQGIC